jgi:WhiB family transcriptional regulator, redox-sensing transcriptional regulator
VTQLDETLDSALIAMSNRDEGLWFEGRLDDGVVGDSIDQQPYECLQTELQAGLRLKLGEELLSLMPAERQVCAAAALGRRSVMENSAMTTLDKETLLIHDLSWMASASCRGHGELFFSPLFERPTARAVRETAAKAYCEQCEVRDECRKFARLNHEFGFWGGENEAERVAAGYRLNAPVGVRRRRSA